VIWIHLERRTLSLNRLGIERSRYRGGRGEIEGFGVM
jgi:hypothetical protein